MQPQTIERRVERLELRITELEGARAVYLRSLDLYPQSASLQAVMSRLLMPPGPA